MRFPNKVITYDESIFPIMIKILDSLASENYSVLSLYNKLKRSGIADLSTYIDSLDALFVLRKITFNPESEELSLC